MESRSAAIAPLSHLGRTARWTTQRRCLSSAHPPWGRVACSRSPIYLFTMPIWLFTMTDPGVHLAPIRAFTLDRSECSPWTETRTLVVFPARALGARRLSHWVLKGGRPC